MIETRSRAHRYGAERRFGLAVGTVFLLLGSWWLFRGKLGVAASVVAGAGGTLIVLGALMPSALYWPNRGWMLLAEKLSVVSTAVVLGLVYFLAVTPIGVAKRLRGWDPLRRRAETSESYWRPYPERQRNPRHYERMY